MGFADTFAGRLQYALQTAKQRERQNDLAEIRVLEITPKVFSVFPDEIRQRCARACLFCHVVLQPSFAQNRIPD
ncbi:hypothetical protein SDC9_161826 [bioreactor metagenome]|uniref:Uncharacterized protein n=1 Tax=bioreactor metagenome TaxID=1076179 RepID=A0A645FMC9_9ZZZZ